MMGKLFNNWISATLDGLFPQKCFRCGISGAYLCDKCTPDIPRSTFFHAENILPIVSPFRYSDPTVRKMIWQLKYYGKSSLAEEMGKHITEELLAWLDAEALVAPDEKIILVPIPIHTGRRKSRGYNQAELLAEKIAEELGGNFILNKKLLKKIRPTEPQARSGGRAQRFENIARAFAVQAGESPGSPIKIILIDDVVTSGATILEARRALTESGHTVLAGTCFGHG